MRKKQKISNQTLETYEFVSMIYGHNMSDSCVKNTTKIHIKIQIGSIYKDKSWVDLDILM